MKVREAARENPAMAILTSLAAVAIAAVSISKGIDLTDSLIMTEAEHVVFETTLSDVELKIDAQSLLNECRWLSDKIDGLDYEIYVLTRDQADPDFIRSKETAVKKHRDKYDVLECVKLL